MHLKQYAESRHIRFPVLSCCFVPRFVTRLFFFVSRFLTFGLFLVLFSVMDVFCLSMICLSEFVPHSNLGVRAVSTFAVDDRPRGRCSADVGCNGSSYLVQLREAIHACSVTPRGAHRGRERYAGDVVTQHLSLML